MMECLKKKKKHPAQLLYLLSINYCSLKASKQTKNDSEVQTKQA